jgi:carbon-monoxide dehydrogenase large subunit
VVEDRSEAFVATTHGRDIVGYVDLAAKRDGIVLGLKLRLIADISAYNMLFTAAIPTFTMLMASATYNIPAIRAAHRGVHQQDADRCLSRCGRPEATFRRARDGHAGARTEDGSAELRRKNFIQPGQFPFTTQMGATADSGDYEKALDVALKPPSGSD